MCNHSLQCLHALHAADSVFPASPSLSTLHVNPPREIAGLARALLQLLLYCSTHTDYRIVRLRVYVARARMSLCACMCVCAHVYVCVLVCVCANSLGARVRSKASLIASSISCFELTRTKPPSSVASASRRVTLSNPPLFCVNDTAPLPDAALNSPTASGLVDTQRLYASITAHTTHVWVCTRVGMHTCD